MFRSVRGGGCKIRPTCFDRSAASWSASVAPGRVENPPLHEPQSVHNPTTLLATQHMVESGPTRPCQHVLPSVVMDFLGGRRVVNIIGMADRIALSPALQRRQR